MTLITWYLTKWCFYSDLAVVHVEGLTAPWPPLGTFLPIWGRFYVRVLLLGSATAQGVTFWVPTHAPNHLVTHFEGVSAFPSYPAPNCPGHDPPSSRICPKGVSETAGVLHESGCPSLVLSLWPWSHPFLLFITAPDLRDLRPSHGVAPSMVFPTHGYRGTTLWLPCFSNVWSGAALVGRRLHLGDALPWRRLFLDDAGTWRLFT